MSGEYYEDDSENTQESADQEMVIAELILDDSDTSENRVRPYPAPETSEQRNSCDESKLLPSVFESYEDLLLRISNDDKIISLKEQKLRPNNLQMENLDFMKTSDLIDLFNGEESQRASNEILAPVVAQSDEILESGKKVLKKKDPETIKYNYHKIISDQIDFSQTYNSLSSQIQEIFSKSHVFESGFLSQNFKNQTTRIQPFISLEEDRFGRSSHIKDINEKLYSSEIKPSHKVSKLEPRKLSKFSKKRRQINEKWIDLQEFKG